MTNDEALAILKQRGHLIGSDGTLPTVDGIRPLSDEVIQLAEGRTLLSRVLERAHDRELAGLLPYDRERLIVLILRRAGFWTILVIERGRGVIHSETENLPGLIKNKACSMLCKAANDGPGLEEACASEDWLRITARATEDINEGEVVLLRDDDTDGSLIATPIHQTTGTSGLWIALASVKVGVTFRVRQL